MKIVYICEPNCTVHKNVNSLAIKKGGYKISAIPLVDVGCIVVFGNTQISTQVMNTLFEKGIDLVFMTTSGLIKGRVLSENASNIILRIAQFDKWRNPDIRKLLANSFITGKLINQRYLMHKYYVYLSEYRIKENISFIDESLIKVKECSDLNTLMGLEGITAKKYFECFPFILKNYEFKGRERRPAHDPVNALLNLGYAFLCNEISTRLSAYSFDLELGFMHGIRYGRKSLSLDLMEEFRAVFIDEFVIGMLNKRIIKQEDFEKSDEGGCILRLDALKKFCSLYQEYIDTKPDPEHNWKKIFDAQLSKFRSFILEGGEYKPYIKNELDKK